MLQLNDRELKEYEKDLKAFAHRAYPFATKATLNTAAFSTRRVAQDTIKGKMIERNKWTRGSVKVEQAKTLNVRRQAAHVGSVLDYMATQEFGGMVRGSGSSKPIPTPSASGESTLPRRKLPRKPNKLRNIQLRRTSAKGANRKQRMVRAVQIAVETGGRTIFLEGPNPRRGIYRVVGGRKVMRGWPKGAKLRLLHDMSRKAVRVPPRPWLAPATAKVQREIPRYYRDALLFQLKRSRVLGY